MRVERNVARALTGTLLLGALALSATGCGPEYVYFRPAENPQAASPGWIAQGRYNLPPGTMSVAAEISARGIIEKQKHEEERRTMEVRFSVRNRGPAPWTLDPATVKIVDDEGRATVGVRAYLNKTPVGPVTVGGGARATFTLVFDVPADVRFESLGSLRVIWPYRYGDSALEVSTKFVRIEEVTYYYPDYYYYPPYYGPYPYPPYGPYYQDPWYYDPWYGPYGYRGGRHRH
jgi:hypothetical protein